MTPEERRDYWHQCLIDWQASDLSGTAFCKQLAIPYHQFSYWRHKLTVDEPDQGEAGVGFARVTAAPPQQEAAPADLTTTSPTVSRLSGYTPAM